MIHLLRSRLEADLYIEATSQIGNTSSCFREPRPAIPAAIWDSSSAIEFISHFISTYQKTCDSKYEHNSLLFYPRLQTNVFLVDVYETVSFLRGLVGFKYEFGSMKSRGKQRRNLDLPEVQLMALIVVATKLLFPFDDLERHPATAKEPATQSIDWSLWVRAQTHFNNRENANGRIGKEQVIQLTDKDVLKMDSGQLDEYMDWYESNWIDSFRIMNPVADMFPTSRTTEAPAPPQAVPPSTLATAADTEEALNSLVHTVMQELKTNQVNPDPEEDDRRPGSWYWRYRWESQLPETAKALYDLAAQLAAVSLQTLIHAVAITEYRIAKTIEDKRRAEYFSQMMELDMEGDADEDSADGMDELDEQLTELAVGGGYDT